jgi:hypothetical protein
MDNSNFGTSLDMAFSIADYFPVKENYEEEIHQPITRSTKVNDLDTNISNKRTSDIKYDPNDIAIEYESHQQQEPMQLPKIAQQQLVYPNSLVSPFPITPSYVDRMISKKLDMIKTMSLALVIVLALTLYNLIDLGIKDIISSYQLKFKQELGLRIGLPILLLLFIWNLKIMKS